MKRTLLILSLILSLFKSFSTQAITIQAKEIEEQIVVNYIVLYEIKHYFSSRMEEVQISIEKILNTSNKQSAFERLIKKAQEGSQESRILLSYLYFDKWFADNSPSQYETYFKNVPWSDEIKKKIHALFYKEGDTPEASFIEALKNYFYTINNNPLKTLSHLKEALRLLYKAKKSGIRDFEFWWAFMALDFYYSGIEIDESSFQNIKEAKSVLLRLARGDYNPAQYLQGLINIKEKSIKKAFYWLKKSHLHNTQPSTFIFISLFYKYLKKDQKLAESFLRKAIYEHDMETLKPDLLDIYLLENNMSGVLKIAREIELSYEIYPTGITLPVFNIMSLLLYEGAEGVEKDIMEALVSFYKMKFLAEEEEMEIPNMADNFEQKLTRRLSANQVFIARQRASQGLSPTTIQTTLLSLNSGKLNKNTECRGTFLH